MSQNVPTQQIIGLNNLRSSIGFTPCPPFPTNQTDLPTVVFDGSNIICDQRKTHRQTMTGRLPGYGFDCPLLLEWVKLRMLGRRYSWRDTRLKKLTFSALRRDHQESDQRFASAEQPPPNRVRSISRAVTIRVSEPSNYGEIRSSQANRHFGGRKSKN